jgi:hypothetical protein
VRILSFQRINWANHVKHLSSKLQAVEFTTWRWPRKDKDWHIGEEVTIVIRSRQKDRVVLGTAVIVNVEMKDPHIGITRDDARADGFHNEHDLAMHLIYGRPPGATIVNKITLRWFGEWKYPLILWCADETLFKNDYPQCVK